MTALQLNFAIPKGVIIKMINIAIDGPAGAGKSTLSKLLAKRFNFIYVDTGALYRVIGLFAHRQGIDTRDIGGVSQLLPKIKLELLCAVEGQRVILNGEDVSAAIRMPEISMAASNVSAIPEVRAFLLQLQQNIARDNDCLMDGRDIGTVVLPNAQIKIFLTASPQDRARRRYEELLERGVKVDYNVVLSEIIVRDAQDSDREIAPLKPADDAVIVDTSGLELEQSLERLYEIVTEKIRKLQCK
jgi:cytidylate kinase